jgi:MFS family permease
MTSRREWALVPTLLFIGAVVSVVSSLGAPLIPTMARDLHASVSSTQWALTATLVVGAVTSPLLGRLGDGSHRKPVTVSCLAIVSVGCAIAALASSLAVLILGRAMQGLGLALMPLTMAAAREHLPSVRAGRTIAALSVVAAAGVGLGYPITGFIAQHLNIAAAFWVGCGFSAAAAALAKVLIPPAGSRPPGGSIDLLGAALVALGVVGILIACTEAPQWGWLGSRTLSLFALGWAFIAAWVVHELTVAEPLVDLRLARHPAVLSADVTAFCLGIAMYLTIVLATQFVQLRTFGFSASVFVAGLTLVPLSILSASGSRALPWLGRRIGIRRVIPVGSLCVAASLVFFAETGTELWQAFVSMGLLGTGLGLTFAAMPGLIVSAVPARETGSAMGFYQVVRFVGFSLGSGLCVSLLDSLGHDGVPTLGSYRSTALIGAGLALATAAIAWWLIGRAEAVPGRTDAVDPRWALEEGLVAAASLEMFEPDLNGVTTPGATGGPAAAEED